MVWTGIYNDIEKGLITYDPLENGSPVCPYCGHSLNLTSPKSDYWYCPVGGQTFHKIRLERINLVWLNYFSGGAK
jgi:hypothetical protein